MASEVEWPRKVTVTGLRLDPRSIQDAAAEICAWARAGEQGYVITVNTQHLDLYQKDMAFQDAYDAARLRVIDGRPIRWLANIKTSRKLPMCPGSDLILPVCQEAARLELSVGVIAASEDIARDATTTFETNVAALRIAGAWAAPPVLQRDEDGACKLAKAVAAVAPDVLFIGVGAPTQELWAQRYLQQCGVGAVLCVGAGIEFLTGRKKRAPMWIRRFGVEAVWRLISEPRRLWRRYLGAGAAVIRARRQVVRDRIRN